MFAQVRKTVVTEGNHIAAHKANLGKPKTEYIVSSEGGLYEVKSVKKAAAQ